MRRSLLLNRRAPFLAGSVGFAAMAAVVASLGMSLSMTLSLGWRAGVALSASGAAGAATLSVLRRRSVGVQVVVVALTAVFAVAATYATTLSMYTTSHDLKLLLAVLTGAASVGVVTALFLARSVVAATQSLEMAAREIGGARTTTRLNVPVASELTTLAHELDETSRRLDAARAHERALEASRRELVAWVSHDLRTPLAGIRAIAEALEDGVVNDLQTTCRYHQTLRKEADQLTALVNDLFELSRIQAGALRLEMERASLADLVSDAIASADPLAAVKGVRLQGRPVPSAPELTLSTPEVARVLRNLLENAIRHTPSDGTVWVSAGLDDQEAIVSVTDTCGGIEDADLSRVFDLAFRAEGARTPSDTNGGGLGLAIAKGLVEAHHGAIAAENSGKGCCFTVRLPLEQPS